MNTQGLTVSQCRGCHRDVVWAVMEKDGKEIKIILDPRPAVYGVTKDADGTVRAHRVETAAVTHFATCPQADRFSRGN